jgi:hypothetical protein
MILAGCHVMFLQHIVGILKKTCIQKSSEISTLIIHVYRQQQHILTLLIFSKAAPLIIPFIQ